MVLQPLSQQQWRQQPWQRALWQQSRLRGLLAAQRLHLVQNLPCALSLRSRSCSCSRSRSGSLQQQPGSGAEEGAAEGAVGLHVHLPVRACSCLLCLVWGGWVCGVWQAAVPAMFGSLQQPARQRQSVECSVRRTETDGSKADQLFVVFLSCFGSRPGSSRSASCKPPSSRQQLAQPLFQVSNCSVGGWQRSSRSRLRPGEWVCLHGEQGGIFVALQLLGLRA